MENILNSCVLNDATIKKIMDVFEDQVRLANTLDPEKKKQSNLLWECTYVQHLMTGQGKEKAKNVIGGDPSLDVNSLLLSFYYP